MATKAERKDLENWIKTNPEEARAAEPASLQERFAPSLSISKINELRRKVLGDNGKSALQIRNEELLAQQDQLRAWILAHPEEAEPMTLSELITAAGVEGLDPEPAMTVRENALYEAEHPELFANETKAPQSETIEPQDETIVAIDETVPPAMPAINSPATDGLVTMPLHLARATRDRMRRYLAVIQGEISDKSAKAAKLHDAIWDLKEQEKALGLELEALERQIPSPMQLSLLDQAVETKPTDQDGPTDEDMDGQAQAEEHIVTPEADEAEDGEPDGIPF